MDNRFAVYEAALDYLFSNTDYEQMRQVNYDTRTYNVDRAAALLAALGNPHQRFRSVHIAGTKGKGSTAAMVEAILRRHGLRTGLYTSPHLVDLRERIQIDRELVDRDLLRRLVGRAADAVDGLPPDHQPTFFEIMTALAFLAFAEQEVDVAVVEVGMGGRLDATNVLVPQVSVITSLSLDHTRQLGPTLEAIAAEKAGIAKPGVPLVAAPQKPEAARVIAETAAAVGAPLVQVGREVLFTWAKAALQGRPAGRVTIETAHAVYKNMTLSLAGKFQGENAACAVAAAEVVLGDDLVIETVRSALAKVEWAGRLQTFLGDPLVVLDGAHNTDSLARLLKSIATYFAELDTIYIFAAAADKDIPGMMAELARAEARVIFTRMGNPRAATPRDLLSAFAAAGGRVMGTAETVEEAWQLARQQLSGGGLIVACGSLYLVGSLLEKRATLGF